MASVTQEVLEEPNVGSQSPAILGRLPGLLTLALALAFTAWFGHLSIASHHALQTTASDLGYYAQAIWSTAQGQPFRTTLMVDMLIRIPGDVDPALLRRPDSLLAYHVEPIVLPLGLLYRFQPGPETLLLVQVVAAAIGAWAIHRLAARVLGSAWAGPAFAAVYLLAPPLHWALTSDFHPVVLGVGAVAFVFDFALGRRSESPSRNAASADPSSGARAPGPPWDGRGEPPIVAGPDLDDHHNGVAAPDEVTDEKRALWGRGRPRLPWPRHARATPRPVGTLASSAGDEAGRMPAPPADNGGRSWSAGVPPAPR
ncbi:MAG TPA: DUF2079 domain-containing protein, partial [Dehalococcoidia bacterium]|nr:DUF2079 domain-containing protein [Dehalococcoidia bacterium]